jgi:hypothetical protein
VRVRLKSEARQHTDLATLDLGSLESVHGGLGIVTCVVLDEAVGRLERNLSQSTVLVEQFKHIALGDPLLG